MPDAVSSQTLVDTVRRTVIKLTNVSDGSGESDVEKVNAAALKWAGATVVLTSAASANASAPNFLIGEVVNAYQGANTANVVGQAVVVDFFPTNNSLIVAQANGTFANANGIIGATSGSIRVQSGALAYNTLNLAIDKVTFAVSPHGSVRLDWKGAGSGGANNRTALVLSGTDHWHLSNELACQIPNNANGTPISGNLLLTTLDFKAASNSTIQVPQGTYTIILELKKLSGYEEPNYQKNNELGFPRRVQGY